MLVERHLIDSDSHHILFRPYETSNTVLGSIPPRLFRYEPKSDQLTILAITNNVWVSAREYHYGQPPYDATNFETIQA